MALNPRQLRFVEHYLGGKPASAAYRLAGYDCRTDRSAEAKASALLARPAVAKAVEAGRAAAAAKAELNAERVIRGLLAEAEDRGADSSHSARVAAWTTLARHLGMLRDRQEVTGPAAGGPRVGVYIPDNGRDPVRLHIVEEIADTDDMERERLARGDRPAEALA